MNTFLRWRGNLVLVLIVLGSLTAAFVSPLIVHTPAAASSGASLTLSVRTGPPTSHVKLTGSGFGTSETVSLTFDTVLLGTTMTSQSGTFSYTVMISGSALPGTHQMQALGETSQRSAQASFLVQTNWAADGYNAQRTHQNPYENVLNTSNVSKLILDWLYQTKQAIQTSPIIVDGIVYIGSTDTYLYALDAQTGTLKWKQKLGLMLSSVAVANRVVYIGSEYGTLYALDAKTGLLKWSYSIVGGGLPAAPVVVGGVAYFDSGNFQMYALDAKTGTLKWAASLETGVGSSVAVSNGVVYVGLSSGHVVALDTQTGAVKWDSVVSPNAVGSELVVANGLVYVSADSIYALDARTGALVWSYLASYPASAFSVAVANGMVYAGLSSTLYAFNAKTGQVLWTYVAGSGIVPSPTEAAGVVYFCSSDGNLYALDAQQGTKLWSYTGNFALSSPTIVNGIVYVGSYSGALDAFHLAPAQT